MRETGSIIAEKENVLIQVGTCTINLLPHLGGKIASIRIDGHELLQTPLGPLAPRTHTMAFDASDASGWDECLPSVAACSVAIAGGPAQVPDHGDLWRVEWERQGPGTSHPSDDGPVAGDPGREQRIGNSNGADGQRGSSITLRGECFSLPLALERTVALSEKKNGWRLSLDYQLTNTGTAPAPWSWAAHPLFAVEPGDRIVLPDSVHFLRVEGSGGNRLGSAGDMVSWPGATLANGNRTDLSVVQPPESGVGDKLFAGPLTGAENWCALERPSRGLRIRMGFDPAATPYLGLWICYRGWPDRPGPKQNCVALEPATAPVDSLALTGPWSRVLEPAKWSKWAMHVDFESL